MPEQNIPELSPDDRAARDILSAPVEPPPGTPRPLWKKVLRFVVLSLLALVAASSVYDLIVWSSAADVFDQAKKAGVPLTYADPFYSKWRSPDLSPETNGAVSFEQAFAILVAKPDPLIAVDVPYAGEAKVPEDPREKLSPEMLSAMAEYVAANTEALDLVHAGARAPECYFQIDWQGFPTGLKHLSKARAAARLLAVKIALDVDEGRAGGAVSSILDGLALARGVGAEPSLISGLVGVAINSIVAQSAAEPLLCRANLSNDELLVLQKAFASAAEGLSFKTNYIGEIALQSDMYERLQAGQVPSVQALQSGDQWARPKVWLRPFAWLARGYFRANRAHSLELMLEAAEAAENPTPAVLNATFWDKWNAKAGDRRYVFASMTLPALTKALQQCERTRARLRSTAVCCAAMRFRNDHGKWPDALAELVPPYMDAVPLDPFTGGTLMYRVDENGITVYSVGENLADEKGAPFLVMRPKGMDDRHRRDTGDDAGARVWK